MNAIHRIADLMLQWEREHESGHEVSPRELCPDWPEGQKELSRRIALLQTFDSAFGLSETLLEPSSDLEPKPPVIPGCAIRGELGRGAMGIVYRAWQHHLQREVAVKMLHVGSCDALLQAWRFTLEARLLARLRHEHIVPVFEAELRLGQPYFVMELVSGGSLAKAQERFSDPPTAARLVEQVARAVQYAHEQGVLHRDLKPGNILLDDKDRPLVTDFGVAKLIGTATEAVGFHNGQRAGAAGPATAGNAVVGTPPYMAPEQFARSSAQVVPQTDVWALGVILYELLTGRRPFVADSMVKFARAIRDDHPPSPGRLSPHIDRALEAIVMRCLAKSADARYPTAVALADDLARWGRGEAPVACPEGTPRRIWRWCRKQPVTAAVLVMAVTAVIAWPVIGYWRSPERHRETMERALTEGRAVTLLGPLGPPVMQAWVQGGDIAKASTESDRPFTVSSFDTALVELWSKPPVAFRMHAEVRHDDGDGFVGIYFDHRPAGRLTAWPCCYVLNFSDRGVFATRVHLPDGRLGSPVTLGFHYFRPRPELGTLEGTQTLNSEIFNVPPTLADGHGPWRRVTLEVNPMEVAFTWTGEGADKPRTVRVAQAELKRLGGNLTDVEPAMNSCIWQPHERGGIGLYVGKCVATFRNVLLEPMESDSQP